MGLLRDSLHDALKVLKVYVLISVIYEKQTARGDQKLATSIFVNPRSCRILRGKQILNLSVFIASHNDIPAAFFRTRFCPVSMVFCGKNRSKPPGTRGYRFRIEG